MNLNPKADDFYTDRGGGAYLRKDHYDHAIKDYDEALKINPKNGEGYLARGQVKESSRNYRGALDDFEQALALNNALFQAQARAGRERILAVLASPPAPRRSPPRRPPPSGSPR